MKALIMAGGLGKRLRPWTNNVPKPLIKIGGKPIIYWQIRWLEAQGIENFVLLGGYKAKKIIDYIKSSGYSDRFEFSVEKTTLGSAGAISNAKGLLEGEDELLVVNGDNITNIDIHRLKLGRNVLCCLSLVPYMSTKGIVNCRGNKITRFMEKPVIKGYWFNAGVALIRGRLLTSLPRKGSLEKDLFPKLARLGRLSCIKYKKTYFRSVDSFKDMEDVNKDLNSGKVKFQ
ncbi:MAG: nucleotidyltransferase family protein [Candidatus Micrarchaeaceae archaeon]